jgi:hypothetical protein
MSDTGAESRPPDDLAARARDVVATLRGRVYPAYRDGRSIDRRAADVVDEMLAEVELLREELAIADDRRGGECRVCGRWICPPLTCMACLADAPAELRDLNAGLTAEVERLRAERDGYARGLRLTMDEADPDWDAKFARVLIENATLAREVERLRSAIREHRDQRDDRRCWLDDLKLYAALDDGPPDPDTTALPPREDFLESCRRYWEQRQCPAMSGKAPMPGGMTIEQLTAEVERLRSTLRSVEWVGGKLYGVFGPLMPCCPACRGIRPGYLPLGPAELGHRHGHREGCPVAAVLGEATEGAAQMEEG